MKRILAVALLFLAGSAYAANPEEGTYYIKANIWYENPMKIVSSNYHRGAIIPVGTEVKVTSFGKEAIKFTIAGKGLDCVLTLVPRHTNISLQALFDRTFSRDNILASGAFQKFNKMEKDNIDKGSIAVGMSKDAVLMAYGYPPSNHTPTLASDIWVYWESRVKMIKVTFKDDKVASMEEEEIETARGRGPRWYHFVP